ncbi:hypothetical protein HMN09_00862100 [Mycena chlorophos]|uniref:AB hydrolase-1 domain-containing protein n=1 Tax=Mycena chlorophos TaxID=658473 RepID=A0A8H6ST34_MYCCL|nr:hypothetical protein HMN09_00862100 [Mycena chlorophos]
MLHQRIHSLPPSSLCPFHVEAVQYLPARSHRDGLTLVFLHATNMHKEQYEVVLRHFFALDSSWAGLRIRDAWCIENPNHGASARRNRTLLNSDRYRDYWTADEYARAAFAFLSSTAHGVDFGARTVVGVAHSAASAPLLMLQRRPLPFAFAGLVFMDAAILPIGTRATQVLCSVFGNWAKTKPRTFDGVEHARRVLKGTAYRGWDERSVELFLKHALRPVDAYDDDDGDAGGERVTLCCSPRQEAAYYLAPTADLVDEPTQIFLQLTKEDVMPIHAIICLNDEYNLFLQRGKGAEMKHFQIEHVNRMRNGSVQIIEGGHMVRLRLLSVPFSFSFDDDAEC